MFILCINFPYPLSLNLVKFFIFDIALKSFAFWSPLSSNVLRFCKSFNDFINSLKLLALVLIVRFSKFVNFFANSKFPTYPFIIKLFNFVKFPKFVKSTFCQSPFT